MQRHWDEKELRMIPTDPTAADIPGDPKHQKVVERRNGLPVFRPYVRGAPRSEAVLRALGPGLAAAARRAQRSRDGA